MNTRVNLREVNFICIFYLNIVLLLKKIKRSKKGRIRVRGVALMRNKYGKLDIKIVYILYLIQKLTRLINV